MVMSRRTLSGDVTGAKQSLPVMRVEVTKDNDAIFFAIRVSIFAFFDFRDGHGQDGLTYGWAQGLIFFFRDVFPGQGGLMKAKVFF